MWTDRECLFYSVSGRPGNMIQRQVCYSSMYVTGQIPETLKRRFLDMCMCVYGHVYVCTCMHVNVCEHIFIDLALRGGQNSGSRSWAVNGLLTEPPTSRLGSVFT